MPHHRVEVKYRQAQFTANAGGIGRQVSALQDNGGDLGVLPDALSGHTQDLLLDGLHIKRHIRLIKDFAPLRRAFQSHDHHAHLVCDPAGTQMLL